MRTNGLSIHKLPLFNTLNKYMRKNSTINTNLNETKFNEWFVGFSDAESNFLIGVDNRGKYTRFNFRFTIGLHIDDRPLLQYIKTQLGCGIIENNKDNTASYFIVTDTSDIKSILLPIFDSFSLNTTKYLDYLSFKEALLLNSSQALISRSNLDSDLKIRLSNINKIIELKNNMNKKRTEFNLPLNHIKISPYWLLGFIEGEGSFYLNRSNFTPAFSLSLTQLQKPIIEKIIIFLASNLDSHSYIKANSTKLFNLSIEKPRNGANGIVKLKISQIDYLFNIFIPFLNTLKFQSKKKLDFNDFKYITTLIYQGKHLIPEIREFIIQALCDSNNMNNLRLSTYNNLDLPLQEVKDADLINFSQGYLQQKEKYLNKPAIYIKNNEGQIINSITKEVIRDTYVIEVIKLDNSLSTYPSIKDCALAYEISRSTIYLRLNSGEPLIDKGIRKFNKIRVFGSALRAQNL